MGYTVDGAIYYVVKYIVILLAKQRWVKKFVASFADEDRVYIDLNPRSDFSSERHHLSKVRQCHSGCTT